LIEIETTHHMKVSESETWKKRFVELNREHAEA